MLKRVLIVAATKAEADAFRRIPGMITGKDGFNFGNCDITLLVTGIGSVATSWAITKWISSNPKPDLAINIGIAGSYRDDIKMGEVVAPVSDCFADAGIETKDSFILLFEAGIDDPEQYPYRGGRIYAENKYMSRVLQFLKPVTGITVNTSTGSEATIKRILWKFNPDIETMEGAAFFYICSLGKIPFVALRSISNRVEPRDKDNWDIPLAINNLSGRVKDILLMLD